MYKELIEIPITTKLYNVPILYLDIIKDSLVGKYEIINREDCYIDNFALEFIEYIDSTGELILLNQHYEISDDGDGFNYTCKDHGIEIFGVIKDGMVSVTSLHAINSMKIGFRGNIKIK